MRWLHRQFRGIDLETALRASRPVPRAAFVHALADRVHRDARPVLRPRARLALAGALTGTMLAAVASAGGIGYAASAARHAAQQATKTVERLVAVSGESNAVEVRGLSAGGDQYQPGFGFGDPSHNHAGPPGLKSSGGLSGSPLRAQISTDGKRVLVTTRILVDEQADLRITVLTPDGRTLRLVQRESRVGNRGAFLPPSAKKSTALGPLTKTIRYRVLIPRVIRLRLSIPRALVETGKRYKIQLVATDPSGLSSTLKIPFIL
jgi:hypothetical protein